MVKISELKVNAKSVLSKSYGMGLLAVFITTVITGVSYSISSTISSIGSFGSFTQLPDLDDMEDLYEYLQSMNSSPMATLGSLASTLFSIFVANIVAVGLAKFFVRLREGESDVGTLFFGFNGKHYMHIVGVVFLRNLFVGLWTLLCVIPGIIKSYAYFMVDFMLGDNPSIDYKRALEISEKTMKGEKWFLFEIYLSFIGWWILVFFTCGLGSIFLAPYIDATKAEFYTYLKAKALANGFATSSDFGENITAVIASDNI